MQSGHNVYNLLQTGRLGWYQEDINVHARLPHLSVYLGHVKPEYTYWYLTATPELLRQAGDVFEQHAEGGL